MRSKRSESGSCCIENPAAWRETSQWVAKPTFENLPEIYGEHDKNLMQCLSIDEAD